MCMHTHAHSHSHIQYGCREQEAVWRDRRIDDKGYKTLYEIKQILFTSLLELNLKQRQSFVFPFKRIYQMWAQKFHSHNNKHFHFRFKVRIYDYGSNSFEGMSASQNNVLTLVQILNVCEYVRTVLASVCTVCIHSSGWQILRLKIESLCAH